MLLIFNGSNPHICSYDINGHWYTLCGVEISKPHSLFNTKNSFSYICKKCLVIAKRCKLEEVEPADFGYYKFSNLKAFVRHHSDKMYRLRRIGNIGFYRKSFGK